MLRLLDQDHLYVSNGLCENRLVAHRTFCPALKRPLLTSVVVRRVVKTTQESKPLIMPLAPKASHPGLRNPYKTSISRDIDISVAHRIFRRASGIFTAHSKGLLVVVVHVRR
jgi:hypothetical protein